MEGFDAIDDFALFERVLTQASRDHERRKSRGMSTPQRTQTSAGRVGASQDTKATPTARLRQGQMQGSVAGSSTSTPIARSRLRRAPAAPAASSPPEDDLDLPSLDDSQFQTYDARATPQREGSAESYVSEDSLPSVGDSQFAASPEDGRRATSQASPIAIVRPSSARRPHRVIEDEDEDESLPAVDDSQFEPSMPAASTWGLAPPAEVGRRATRRQSSRSRGSADPPTAQRITRRTAAQSQSQSIPDSLPSPDDSQFEQSAPAPSARVTRSRAPPQAPAIADIREEPDESQQAMDLSDDDDLPAINDSQFEQTQTQRPVPAPRLRGESAELAAAEEFLLPVTPMDTDNEDGAGERARPDGEPESDPKSSAQESVVVVVEAQQTMVEDVRVEPADVTGTAAEPIDVEREPETALPRQTEAAPQSTPRGTAQEPVIIDDEPVQRTPRATRPSAGPRSSVPSTPAATLAQPSPSQFRRQSRREDPTEFAPPDDTDLTEVERRGEEPIVVEPEHPLHGPRKPRRSSASRRLAAAPPSQQSPARVVQTVSVAQQTETIVDEEAAFEEELLLEMDRERRSSISHRIHDAEDEDSANDERRQRRNSRHSSHLDPASAPLQIASQRRQDTPQPPDPFMFDADGSPLRVRWGYMVPPDYTAPKSRIHGQREGQAFKYSRLSGQRMRWTKEQTLLLYRTVQKVPLRVENPMDVVMYLYGEFGVRSQDLAFYNKQHMRSRMVTVVETRMRNNLPIEGRARMFLPPREPRRMGYEKELKAFRVKDEAERVAIKEEMQEARAAAREEDVSDFSDEREEDDAGQYGAGYDQGDYSSDRGRGRSFRDDEDMSEDEDDRTPPPRQKRKTPYVDIVRRRPHPPPRKRQHLDESSGRDRDEQRANRRRLARDHDDSDSDWEEPRYYRRRHEDFADTPAFTLDTAPTPPPQSPPSSPVAASRRRLSAPGRLAGGGRRGPRASRPSAFDHIMEEEESEQEWEGYGPPPGGPAPGFRTPDHYPSSSSEHISWPEDADEEGELDDQDAGEVQPPPPPPARRQTRASDRVPAAQPEPAEERAPEDEDMGAPNIEDDEDLAAPNPPPPARPSPPRRQTRASTRASTRATTRASAPVADTQPGRRITRSSARRESEELPPPAGSAPAASASRVRTYGKRGRGHVVTEEQAEADAEEQVNAEAAAQGEEGVEGNVEGEHQEQEEDEDMKEDDDGDDDGDDAEGESELEEGAGAGEGDEVGEEEGEDEEETQDASLVVRRELVRQKVLRGG